MNVSFNPENEQTATLKITIQPEDYQPSVEKELKKYQQRAAIPGFRPGKAPMGMIKRSVGKSILVDEVNRIASQEMLGYLRDNNIDILAQPLISEKEQSVIDFEKEGDFVFAFEVALAPRFELNISAEDTVTSYDIEVSDKQIDEEIENIKRRNGTTAPAESAELKDIIYAEATELNDDGSPLEGGISAKPISLTPELVKNEALQKKLTGTKKGDTLTADIRELFDNNETVMSHTLGIPKEGVADLNRNFSLTITDIQRFSPAEINQELFDKLFGPGAVTDEAALRERIRKDLEEYYRQESDQFVEHSINHLITDKHTFALPDEFLKRWLIQTKPEEYNEGNVDQRYAGEAGSLRYLLVQEKIVEKYNVEVTPEDLEKASLGYTANLFRQYGMYNPDYETVKQFSDRSMQQEKYRNTVKDVAMRKKVIDELKKVVTLNPRKIGVEAFYDMIREHNKQHGHDQHDH